MILMYIVKIETRSDRQRIWQSLVKLLKLKWTSDILTFMYVMKVIISKDFKDPLPHNVKSNIVYKIFCKDCDARYVRHTSRQ